MAEWTAEAIARAVRAGELSAAEVVAEALRRIDRTDRELGSFLWRRDRAAGEEAARIDQRRRRGATLGALAGVPVAIKDNLALCGAPLSCGSRILEGFVSPYTATAVERLRAADAVVVGKTNLDEFAMGSSCENSALQRTRNPWRTDLVPGGSSGGSAAAVAAGLVPVALGSDTGGSVRQPAAFCGVVGVKPTYGRVSRHGLVAFASSLDQVGPLATNVRDAALVLQTIAGHDPYDATTLGSPVADYLAEIDDQLSPLRVGLIRELDLAALPADVRADWQAAVARLEGLGARCREVSVPNLGAAVAAYYVVANSEASANLARFDGIRYGRRVAGARNLLEVYAHSRSEGFGAEVKRRIMLGTYALSSGYYDQYYGRARAVVRALRTQLRRALREVDVLVTPTAPAAAFALGEKVDDPLAMYLSDVFTTPASLTGLPAVAVPSGLDARGVPLSLQLMARHGEEPLLLRAARAFERATGFEPHPQVRAGATPWEPREVA